MLLESASSEVLGAVLGIVDVRGGEGVCNMGHWSVVAMPRGLRCWVVFAPVITSDPLDLVVGPLDVLAHATAGGGELTSQETGWLVKWARPAGVTNRWVDDCYVYFEPEAAAQAAVQWMENFRASAGKSGNCP